MNLINHFLKVSALAFASNAAVAADDISTDDTLRGSPILVNSLTETIFGENDDRTIVENAAGTRSYIGGIGGFNDDGALLTNNDGSPIIKCTATLIVPPANYNMYDERPLIISAAHCFNPSNVEEIIDGKIMGVSDGSGVEPYTRKLPNYAFISKYVDDKTGVVQQYISPIVSDSLYTTEPVIGNVHLTDIGFALLAKPLPEEITPIPMKTMWGGNFTWDEDTQSNKRVIETGSVKVSAYGYSRDVPGGQLAVHENCGTEEVKEHINPAFLQTHCDVIKRGSGGPLILETTEGDEFVVAVNSYAINVDAGSGGAPLDITHPYAKDNGAERFSYHAIIEGGVIPGTTNSEAVLPTPAIVKPPKL